MFKKLLRAFDVGGPTVGTVLASPNTRPGDAIEGRIDITGGTRAVTIETVNLTLTTKIAVEPHAASADGEYPKIIDFHKLAVGGAFDLGNGERRSIPFHFPIPWETPITDVYGRRLPGMVMGIRTELAVARGVDKGGLDAISVHPLPAQAAILDAFLQLGFRFKRADLERGQLRGVQQTLPFHQEIEFHPAPRYAGRINEVELTFVANPHAIDIILELDKRDGPRTSGRETVNRFTVSHAEVDQVGWGATVDSWVSSATR